MAETLVCPNSRTGGSCPRSDPVVLACSTTDDYYQFGCRTCRCGWVVHTPQGVAKAKVELELKRRNNLHLRDRDKLVFGMYNGSQNA